MNAVEKDNNMNTREMSDLLSWMKTTDLVEAAYKNGSGGFDLRLENAPSYPEVNFPQSALIPVSSPAVGIFRFGPVGTPGKAEAGKPVTEGQALGMVEMGQKNIEVKAPASGKIIKTVIEDGKPVEFGQTLFLLSP